MKKFLTVMIATLMVCAVACISLAGCSGGGSDSPKEYDFTVADVSSDDLSAALSTEDKDHQAIMTIEGTFEAKDTGGYVVHLYIGGENYHESIYCDLGEIDPATLPANDTMVVAHGTYKHMTDSPNDYSFLFYLDSLEAK